MGDRHLTTSAVISFVNSLFVLSSSPQKVWQVTLDLRQLAKHNEKVGIVPKMLFFYIMWMAGCVCVAYQGKQMAPGYTKGRLTASTSQRRQCDVPCSAGKALGHAIHMDTLNLITFLNIVADHVPMETVFHDGCDFLQ